MAEIHLVKVWSSLVCLTIGFQGRCDKQTKQKRKQTKKHDDMLSCCATKKVITVQSDQVWAQNFSHFGAVSYSEVCLKFPWQGELFEVVGESGGAGGAGGAAVG